MHPPLTVRGLCFLFWAISLVLPCLRVKKFSWFQQNILFERNSSLKTVLGNFDNELFKDADTVVVSPGVPLAKYGLSSLLHSVSWFTRIQVSVWNGIIMVSFPCTQFWLLWSGWELGTFQTVAKFGTIFSFAKLETANN